VFGDQLPHGVERFRHQAMLNSGKPGELPSTREALQRNGIDLGRWPASSHRNHFRTPVLCSPPGVSNGGSIIGNCCVR
jgi:hypothetical protein